MAIELHERDLEGISWTRSQIWKKQKRFAHIACGIASDSLKNNVELSGIIMEINDLREFGP
jgi:hypothetical protein